MRGCRCWGAVLLLCGIAGAASKPQCTPAAAKAAAPEGVTIGPIRNLNPSLPRVPDGALAVPATDSTSAYCLVTGSVLTNPRTGNSANFAVALPAEWNRKFLFSGCSGYCGVVFQNPPDDKGGGGFPRDALERGYAIVATDGGHAGTPADPSWALKAPGKPDTEALADYFYRAVHTATVAGKQFVEKWYSGKLARSYFFGCSEGGREGMVEAARYPEDYDGYVVGAPAFDIPGRILGGRAARALVDAPDSYIPPDLLKVVEQAILASCDEVDGVKDNLIQSPGRCSFTPQSLVCDGTNTGLCLKPNQAKMLLAWFSAAKDAEGRVASFGFSVSDIYGDGAGGGSLFRWAGAAGPPRDAKAAEPWGGSDAGQPAGWTFYDQSLKYLVFLDPKFDSNRNAPVSRSGVADSRALALIEERTRDGRGDSPGKLAKFLGSDRKMILYHGYSDGFVTPFRTVRFYEDWAKAAGGYDALRKNARLFMVPGMYHCRGGPGPNSFDALGALDAWVEKGAGPDRIIANKYQGDDPEAPILRSMPLCAFPRQATYTWKSDVNNAVNWTCELNRDLLRVGPNGVLAGLASPTR